MASSDEPPDENIAQMELNTFVRFEIPRGMHSKYAQHLIIQPGENEVTLSFFELVFPPLSGTPEMQAEVQRQMQEKGVPAECVARVAIPLRRFPAFARAMQGIVERITIPGEGGEPSHESNSDDPKPDADGKENS